MILDVGGERFTALRSSLSRFPTTRSADKQTLILMTFSVRLGRLIRAETVR